MKKQQQHKTDIQKYEKQSKPKTICKNQQQKIKKYKKQVNNN